MPSEGPAGIEPTSPSSKHGILSIELKTQCCYMLLVYISISFTLLKSYLLDCKQIAILLIEDLVDVTE